MKSSWMTRVAIASLFVAFAAPAQAQGKGKAAGKNPDKSKTVVTKVAKGPKHVTTSQAILVTRDVLVANGYTIVNIVPSGTARVLYYRRGNMGRGRGLGPVHRLHIVPNGQIVSFRSVPDPLLSTILRRLGL